MLAAARADLVFYLAGVDPARGDRYGRMNLTRAGLAARERMVFESLRAAGAPVVLLLSGGYAATPRETAMLHAIAYRVAVNVFEAPRAVQGES